MGILKRLLRHAPKRDEDAYLYQDLFERMTYRAVGAANHEQLPTVIGYRVLRLPEVEMPDQRPSFAMLESPKEVQKWEAAFVSPVEYDHLGAISDYPLSKWNYLDSMIFSEDCSSGIFLPENENGVWPQLGIVAGGQKSSADGTWIRGRYRYRLAGPAIGRLAQYQRT